MSDTGLRKSLEDLCDWCDNQRVSPQTADIRGALNAHPPEPDDLGERVRGRLGLGSLNAAAAESIRKVAREQRERLSEDDLLPVVLFRLADLVDDRVCRSCRSVRSVVIYGERKCCSEPDYPPLAPEGADDE